MTSDALFSLFRRTKAQADSNAAGVAIENCLNEGVHPKTLWGLLWVDYIKKAGNCG
jgi:hypothetical protein